MKSIDVEGKALVLHHWDTDGVCSASILLNHLDANKVETMTPTIGNYFLSKDEIRFCRGFDHVFIVDMALPEKNVKDVCVSSEVTIFDHHLQKPIKGVNHNNPVAYGKSQQGYPSATWVLKEYFKYEVTLPVVLGIVGDNEHKIKNNKRFFDIVEEYCRGHSLSFDDLLRMVYLIDSNYKMQRKTEVEGIPWLLMEGDVAEKILENLEWNSNLRVLEGEVNRILSDETLITERNSIAVMRINTPYNIISTVTRRFAWETGKNVVVVNKGFYDDKDQLYVRSSNVDLSSLIGELKNSGFYAGGKGNVMGVVVPKNKTEDLLEKVVGFFGGKRI
ncbi:MAG: single-stranded DNA-specific exonuclease [Thermoplasmata archaeon]|nr:MAG: single-stranded DNA-specific exonuclease [Thermoplasmata archaeon]